MCEPDRDERYHERGCPHFDMRPPTAANTHADLFCDCHHFTVPEVLRGGSDIAWPAGWTEKEAGEWRRRHNLVRPENS
jgi:hypothetical protein